MEYQQRKIQEQQMAAEAAQKTAQTAAPANFTGGFAMQPVVAPPKLEPMPLEARLEPRPMPVMVDTRRPVMVDTRRPVDRRPMEMPESVMKDEQAARQALNDMMQQQSMEAEKAAKATEKSQKDSLIMVDPRKDDVFPHAERQMKGEMEQVEKARRAYEDRAAEAEAKMQAYKHSQMMKAQQIEADQALQEQTVKAEAESTTKKKKQMDDMTASMRVSPLPRKDPREVQKFEEKLKAQQAAAKDEADEKVMKADARDKELNAQMQAHEKKVKAQESDWQKTQKGLVVMEKVQKDKESAAEREQKAAEDSRIQNMYRQAMMHEAHKTQLRERQIKAEESVQKAEEQAAMEEQMTKAEEAHAKKASSFAEAHEKDAEAMQKQARDVMPRGDPDWNDYRHQDEMRESQHKQQQAENRAKVELEAQKRLDKDMSVERQAKAEVSVRQAEMEYQQRKIQEQQMAAEAAQKTAQMDQVRPIAEPIPEIKPHFGPTSKKPLAPPEEPAPMAPEEPAPMAPEEPPEVVVEAEVSLSGMTESQFEAPAVRLAFAQTVAQAARVPPENVEITGVSSTSGRRLLSGVQVAFTVTPDERSPSAVPISQIGASITTAVADTTSNGFASSLASKAKSQGVTISVPTIAMVAAPKIEEKPAVAANLMKNPALLVMWNDAELTKTSAGRVDKTSFRSYFTNKYDNKAVNSKMKDAFSSYVDSVFETALKLHLPVPPQDLSQKDFISAAALVGEFFFGEEKGPDLLRLNGPNGFITINAEAKNMTEAQKLILQDDGRVHQELFNVFFMNKNGWTLTTTARTNAYSEFINSVFDTVTKMCLPRGKTTIDETTFKYADIFANQFDFGALPPAPASTALASPIRSTEVEEMAQEVKELLRRRDAREAAEVDEDNEVVEFNDFVEDALSY